MSRSTDPAHDKRWQSDPDFFKWRLFIETFEPQDDTDNERFKLILMALNMFKKASQRRSEAYTSDTLLALLDELRAFRNSITKPAKKYISEDVRNLNLLAETV